MKYYHNEEWDLFAKSEDNQTWILAYGYWKPTDSILDNYFWKEISKTELFIELL